MILQTVAFVTQEKQIAIQTGRRICCKLGLAWSLPSLDSWTNHFGQSQTPIY
jgi:hypothetical protein